MSKGPTILDVTCDYCGRTFKRSLKVYNNKVKEGKNQFCSIKCSRRNQTRTNTSTRVTIHCAQCGCEFEQVKSYVDRMSQKGSRLTCSDHCRAVMAGYRSGQVRRLKSDGVDYQEDDKPSDDEQTKCQFCSKPGVYGYCDALCEELHTRPRGRQYRTRDRAWPERRGEVLER